MVYVIVQAGVLAGWLIVPVVAAIGARWPG